MTGWTTFNFVAVDYDDYNKRGWPDDDLWDYLDTGFSNISLARMSACAGGIVARVSGYREWEEDESVLMEVEECIDKAVVIQANDTSDTGQARLYVKEDSEFVERDSYAEDQGRDGVQVGSKAAAYMQFRHDIPCVANTRVFWRRNE